MATHEDTGPEPIQLSWSPEEILIRGSNVNVVDAMVEMISLTRSYEMSIKMMQTAQQNSEISAQLLQVQ
jgi:flagellar basal-body rod protein FlgF